ncbi:hypothetical protein BaOVIS_008740 [Babesia ovis]|uniref:CSC1/OSCA1-like 7TM region domain-containing protein n=1 Tax=Babesia ovis TaxID=5869 RepID=A0A9W5T8T4_BABOV|nr:hypothetical protein BaOVIS_008740 [Babesia ovis]
MYNSFSATDTDFDCNKSESNSESREGDDNTGNWSLYISLAKSRKSKRSTRETSTRGEGTWWYYLLYGKDNRILNNEAVLYLKFIRSTCYMLIIYSAVAIVSNVIIFTHLALNNKPQFLFTYSIDDMRNCKVVVWTLYATTWIYSFIVYIHILKFRRKVNSGKQITVMLRPQLHTLMIYGFDKNITDPMEFYRHFDSYFPEHVLAVHVVVDHSKRMQLEEELDATKAQLCLCRDMALRVNKNRKTKGAKPKTDTEMREQEPSVEKPRRTKSCSNIHQVSSIDQPNENVQEVRSTVSSSNIISQPKDEEKEPAKSSGNFRRGVVRQITRFIAGKESDVATQQDLEDGENFGDLFVNLLKKVKELKAKIEEEANREHSTSARVCFVSFADTNIVMHILRDRNILEAIPEWRIRPAPHPRDIIWQNLHIPRYSIFIRMVVCNLLLVIFYVIITWILSHLNLLQTVKRQEMIDGAAGKTFSVSDLTERSFWSALMPPLIMATLNTCVHPTLINFFSRKIGMSKLNSITLKTGFWTHSTYQRYLLFGHVFYLVINTILIPLVASMIAFWKIFNGAFDSLSLDLGQVLVNTTWRFSTIYVFNAIFLGSSNQLLQLSQVMMRSICIYFFKFDLGITNFDFGYWYAFHLSILTLVMLFSLFVPYLPILGVLYFAVRYCVDRHNLAYHVLQLPLDSTGKIGASAVKSMLICISLTQFAMSGVFLNCQGVLPPVCITLLYIASVATWLLMYESNADFVVKFMEPLYNFKLKPLNKGMMDTIKLCYMHPCDAKDLVNGKNSHMYKQ